MGHLKVLEAMGLDPSSLKLRRAGTKKPPEWFPAVFSNGAGEETRTLDVHLGKVVLYQLSYARSAEGKCYATPR
jgi:hypothetical protein